VQALKTSPCEPICALNLKPIVHIINFYTLMPNFTPQEIKEFQRYLTEDKPLPDNE
jgi:hypothetical protein